MRIPEIDLPKMANVAGSAIALIIATCIFLSWVSARYVPTFDRLRQLTAELRGFREQNRRRDGLKEQVNACRRRLRLMNRATGLLCGVMACAVATIVAAIAVAALPPRDELTGPQIAAANAVAVGGAAALLLALALHMVAVGLMAVENRIDRRTIEAEVRDLDEVEGG